MSENNFTKSYCNIQTLWLYKNLHPLRKRYNSKVELAETLDDDLDNIICIIYDTTTRKEIFKFRPLLAKNI